MVTFSDLLHADLGKLQAAADEWKLLPKKYQGLQEHFEARVTKPLKSDWQGHAADQAQESLTKIKKQYGAAAEEAQAIATLLLDAHSEFSAAQKKLRRIIDEDAAVRSSKCWTTARSSMSISITKAPPRHIVMPSSRNARPRSMRCRSVSRRS